MRRRVTLADAKPKSSKKRSLKHRTAPVQSFDDDFSDDDVPLNRLDGGAVSAERGAFRLRVRNTASRVTPNKSKKRRINADVLSVSATSRRSKPDDASSLVSKSIFDVVLDDDEIASSRAASSIAASVSAGSGNFAATTTSRNDDDDDDDLEFVLLNEEEEVEAAKKGMESDNVDDDDDIDFNDQDDDDALVTKTSAFTTTSRRLDSTPKETSNESVHPSMKTSAASRSTPIENTTEFVDQPVLISSTKAAPTETWEPPEFDVDAMIAQEEDEMADEYERHLQEQRTMIVGEEDETMTPRRVVNDVSTAATAIGGASAPVVVENDDSTPSKPLLGAWNADKEAASSDRVEEKRFVVDRAENRARVDERVVNVRRDDPTRHLASMAVLGISSTPIVVGDSVKYVERPKLTDEDRLLISRKAREIVRKKKTSTRSKKFRLMYDRAMESRIDEDDSSFFRPSSAPSSRHHHRFTSLHQKYAPKLFIDLISSERKNLLALQWIKRWDGHVFNKATKKNASLEIAEEFVWRKKKRRVDEVVGDDDDEDDSDASTNQTTETENESSTTTKPTKPTNKKKRTSRFKSKTMPPPEKRALMIAGKTGTCKSTLARIVAKHAGYRVVEIGASELVESGTGNDDGDDGRSSVGSRVRRRVERLMKMNALFQTKPNCVVVDEADSLPVAASRALALVCASSNRPLVIVCADAFAPSLRALRAECEIIQLKAPSTRSLVSRARRICLSENVDVRPGSVELLCKSMGNDPRSVLNGIEFALVSRDADEPAVLSVESIREFSVGRKDERNDLWRTWSMLFRTKHARSKLLAASGIHVGARRLANDDENPRTGFAALEGLESESNFHQIYAVMRKYSSVKDVDRVFQGVHENFPLIDYQDSVRNRTSDATSWLSYADSTLGRAVKGDSSGVGFGFPVLNYAPLAAVAVNSIVGKDSRVRVTYPRMSLARYNTEVERAKGVVSDVRDGPAAIRCASSLRNASRVFPSEYASPLVRILTPTDVRPVPSRSFTLQEKQKIDRISELMFDLGIKFSPAVMRSAASARSEESRSYGWSDWSSGNDPSRECVFSPEIELLSRTFGYFCPTIHPTLVDRIARGVSKRRRTFQRSGLKRLHSSFASPTRGDASTTNELSPFDSGVATNKKKRRRRETDVEVPDYTIDFFGRKVPLTAKEKSVRFAQIENSRLSFSFNEGCTDAVRRKVQRKEAFFSFG